MIKARLFLILSGILSASWFYLGLNLADKPDHFGFFDMLAGFGMILGPILFLATIFMLVFSFFRVNETSDGKLEYDQSNLHWRLLKRFFAIEENISLCSAFWLTSLMTFLTVFFTGAAILFTWITFKDSRMWLEIFSKMLPVLAFLGSFFIAFIPYKVGMSNPLARKVSSFLLLAVFAGWFVILPFYLMLVRDNLTISVSVWKYLAGIGEMVLHALPIYAALGPVLLMAKYFSSISPDSLLKRMFATFKNNMCPILYGRPLAGK